MRRLTDQWRYRVGAACLFVMLLASCDPTSRKETASRFELVVRALKEVELPLEIVGGIQSGCVVVDRAEARQQAEPMWPSWYSQVVSRVTTTQGKAEEIVLRIGMSDRCADSGTFGLVGIVLIVAERDCASQRERVRRILIDIVETNYVAGGELRSRERVEDVVQVGDSNGSQDEIGDSGIWDGEVFRVLALGGHTVGKVIVDVRHAQFGESTVTVLSAYQGGYSPKADTVLKGLAVGVDSAMRPFRDV